MLASDDKDLIHRARFLSQQARERSPHYEHTEIGYNYRMSNILAAIGRGQIEVLDERVKQKRKIFAWYKNALKDVPGIEFMPEADYGVANRWLSVILITPSLFGADREDVRLALKAEDIESRPVWKPMHMQPVFQDNRTGKQTGKKTYPCWMFGGAVSEDFYERGLCLPSGTAMTKNDLSRVVKIILGVCSSENWTLMDENAIFGTTFP